VPCSPYADCRDELVERICQSLAAGVTMAEICRQSDMPRQHTVWGWQRADPALKARLHAARGWSWLRGDAAARDGMVGRLIQRLEGGWTLHRACREPGAPSRQTVHNWTRDDPTLRERLRRAQAWGVQFRPRHNPDRFRYDYDRVDRFLARVRLGASVEAMQAAREAPDRQTIRAWKLMRPEFVDQYETAKRAAAAARRTRPRRRRPFDPGVADRIVARVNRGDTLAALVREDGMPGRKALRRWRRTQPGFAFALRLAVKGGQRNRARARAGPGPELTRRIGHAIAAGATIKALCARPGMPNIATFYVWQRRYPAFAAVVGNARDFRDWMRADRAAALAEMPQA